MPSTTLNVTITNPARAKSAPLGRLALGMALGAGAWAGTPSGLAPRAVAAPAVPAAAFTVSGSISKPGATATAPAVPLAGVRVALIPSNNLGSIGTLLLSKTNPRLSITNASGQFSFAGVAAGTYYVTPYSVSPTGVAAVFAGKVGSTTLPAPSPVRVSANTVINFSQVGSDAIKPKLTLDRPVAGANASAPVATGTLDDAYTSLPASATASGPLGVVALLYKGSGASLRIYNFNSTAVDKFEPVTPASLLNSNYYKVSIALGPAAVKPGEKVLRGTFSIPLPALPAGSYRLTMAGVDRSLQNTALTNRDFSIGTPAPPPVADKVPASAVVLKVGATTVGAGSPQNPTVVSSFAEVSGSASDSGSGVASVKLYVLKNLKVVSVFPVAVATADFWNGTSFESKTLQSGIAISSLPSVAPTLAPAGGGASVTWKRTGGLPVGAGDFGLLAIALDKAGNKPQPDVLSGLGDLLAIQGAIRTIRVTSSPAA